MRLLTFACAVLLAVVAAGPVLAAEPSPLAPLDFLLGTWEGGGSGKSGDGSGSATFRRELQGRVIVRTNHADYPAAGDRPATTHDDLMVIYPEGRALKADYYDNEGHVIRYTVAAPAPGQAVFVSDPVDGSPRFRLTYASAGGGTVTGRFEIAPPGQPDAFTPYLAWTMRHPATAAP